ncbi:MAG TPA: hypothetical protein VE954_04070 [Oligoflexus sp.]|nr:hypothetical protein [Oligoflexus sp.]
MAIYVLMQNQKFTVRLLISADGRLCISGDLRFNESFAIKPE